MDGRSMSREEFISPYESFSVLLRQLPTSMLNPHRAAILLEIYGTGGVNFVQLRKDQGLTDGALATHLKYLVSEGFVSVAKEMPKGGTREKTAYLITPKGIQEIQTFLKEFKHAAGEIPA
jgi:predicted ArsR family transcriptional regulator